MYGTTMKNKDFENESVLVYQHRMFGGELHDVLMVLPSKIDINQGKSIENGILGYFSKKSRENIGPYKVILNLEKVEDIDNSAKDTLKNSIKIMYNLSNNAGYGLVRITGSNNNVEQKLKEFEIEGLASIISKN